MAIYAISDLHLALSIDKPMDVFGGRWSNYMEKLKTNWESVVGPEDFVLVPGDISWATYLEQAVEDFCFIDALPGIKIISKGNHDYWWTTMSKLTRFIEERRFSTIRFLHNNSIRIGKVVLCGTRGWKCPGDGDFSAEDEKIYRRELQRLELSLKSTGAGADDTVIVALHYPPFSAKNNSSEFVEIMMRYQVKQCIFGHLHGDSFKSYFMGDSGDIRFQLVSADYLEFKPLRLLQQA